MFSPIPFLVTPLKCINKINWVSTTRNVAISNIDHCFETSKLCYHHNSKVHASKQFLGNSKKLHRKTKDIFIENATKKLENFYLLPELMCLETISNINFEVLGGLPDEVVELNLFPKLADKKRLRYTSNVTTVFESSKHRVEPKCPHFGYCGGCKWQHLSWKEQINLKKDLILKEFASNNIIPRLVLDPITLPDETEGYKYRRQARISIKCKEVKVSSNYFDGAKSEFDDSDSSKSILEIGFRSKLRSSKISDFKECPILVDPFSHPRFIGALRQLILSLSCRNLIPQLEVVLPDQKPFIIIRILKELSELKQSDFLLLSEFEVKENVHLFLHTNSKRKRLVEVSTKSTDFEPFSYNISTEQGKKFAMKISPENFLQINKIVNNKMISHVIESLNMNKDDMIWDFFCGVGNITIPVCSFHPSEKPIVVGAEFSKEMVDQANRNAQQNGLEMNFYAGNLYEIMEQKEVDMENDMFKEGLKRMKENNLKHSKVIVNPPRSGVLNMFQSNFFSPLSEFNVERIVYVSCNPVTLARDLGILCGLYNFKVKSFRFVDMFPQTGHCESVTVIERVC